MEDNRITLLLDIDGVFNGVMGGLTPERLPGGGVIWPIPLANTLLQTIEQDERLEPIWCTSWWTRAWLWNDRSGTPHWPIAHLLKPHEAVAAFPDVLPRGDYDWKLAAALYYRKQHPTRRMVWIEDGFFQETLAWAATDPLVTLVDTTAPHVLGMLLRNGNSADAAQAFLATFVFGSLQWPIPEKR